MIIERLVRIFFREIEMYVNDDNDAEYRAIFVFDN